MRNYWGFIMKTRSVPRGNSFVRVDAFLSWKWLKYLTAILHLVRRVFISKTIDMRNWIFFYFKLPWTHSKRVTSSSFLRIGILMTVQCFFLRSACHQNRFLWSITVKPRQAKSWHPYISKIGWKNLRKKIILPYLPENDKMGLIRKSCSDTMIGSCRIDCLLRGPGRRGRCVRLCSSRKSML